MDAKILIVDDDPAIRNVWDEYLSLKGFTVITAGTSREAQSKLEGAKFNLLIVDALLPDTDGFRLVADIRAKEEYKETPIIMISGVYRSAKHGASAIHDLGVSIYIDKPITPETIECEILKILAPKKKYDPVRDQAAQRFEAKKDSGHFYLLNPLDAPLSGRVENCPIPVVFNKIFRYQLRGALQIKNGDLYKIIAFNKGNAIGASSNVVSECLGQTLVRMGRITEEQNRISLEFVKQTGRKQGDALVAKGFIYPYELPGFLIRHQEDRIMSSFEMTAGDYVFQKLDEVPSTFVNVEKNTPTLIKEGIMNYLPAGWIWINAFENYKYYAIGATGEGQAFSSKAFFNKAELKFLASLDFSKNFDETIESSPFDQNVTERLLFVWIVTGMAALKKSEEPRRREPTSFDVVIDEDAEAPSSWGEEPSRPSVKDDLPPPPKSTILNPAPSAPAVNRNARVVAADAAAEESQAAALNASQRLIYDELNSFYQSMKDKNYFEVFGVEKTAQEKEIKASYFKLARKFHPDSVQIKDSPVIKSVADKIFSIITKGYATLTNAEKRKEYEKKLAGQSDDASEELINIMNSEARFLEVKGAIKRRDWKAAKAFIDECLKMNPNEGEFQAYAAWIKLNLTGAEDGNALKRAFVEIKKALEKSPKSEQAHYFLGMVILLMGKPMEAMREFEETVKISPYHEQALAQIRNLQRNKENITTGKEGGLLGGLLGKKDKDGKK